MATINLGAIKFNWKGAYSGATAYVVDDVVESSGSSYICIAATTGNAPPNATYWEQMSSAGTNGTDLTTTLTTQGDIVYRDASGLARLGAGTAGQALITNGTGANPSWGDAGGGKVLQVVQGTINSFVGINSTSFTSTGLNVNITPSASDSKILLLVNAHADDSSSSIQQYATIYRDATNIGNGNQGLTSIYTDGRLRGSMNMSVLDSPATTSQINYEVYFRSSSAGDRYFNSENCLATIIAMEIGA